MVLLQATAAGYVQHSRHEQPQHSTPQQGPPRACHHGTKLAYDVDMVLAWLRKAHPLHTLSYVPHAAHCGSQHPAPYMPRRVMAFLPGSTA